MGSPIGKRFGKLIVLGTRWERNAAGNPVGKALVRCDCGEEYEANYANVVKSKVKQCAKCCAAAYEERSSAYSKHPLFVTWWGMNDRCANPKHHAYANYGGRGVVVCERWRRGADDRAALAAFAEDMGKKPYGASIDRIDNNGPYSPENCRWASIETQANNRRNNVRVRLNGEDMTVAEAARKLGVESMKIRGPVVKYNMAPQAVVDAISAAPKRRAKWTPATPSAKQPAKMTEEEREEFDAYLDTWLSPEG